MQNFKQAANFARRTGASVPYWLAARFEGLDTDVETRRLVAAAVAAEQVLDLVDEGVEDFHFYSMNRSDLVYAICHLLGLRSQAPAKPAAKPAAKPVERAPVQDARPVLVRDSFTMPEREYAVLLDVKQACLRAGIDVKKSELLRIGVALLGQLDVATLQSVLGSLPQLKTGRPPQG